jgi:hypothetical protein
MNIILKKMAMIGVFSSAFILWGANANASHDHKIKIIKGNTFLMSDPSKQSKVILKLPKGYDRIRGCITSDLSRSDYRKDRLGNEWYLLDVYKDNNYSEKSIVKGWIMKRNFVISGGSCPV